MAKRQLTHNELLIQLQDQVGLLMYYCKDFDEGKLVFAKPIATTLRVLLHSRPGSNSRALLDQLGFRAGRWRSVARSGHPRDQNLPCTLIGVSVSMTVGTAGYSAGCFAKLNMLNEGVRRIPFSVWLTEPVAYNHRTRKTFSRMDIVRHVTDTDGGAHVDHSLDESYLALRDGEFLSVRAVANTGLIGISLSHNQGDPIPGAVGAAIRTIAHETLLTLEDCAAQAFTRPYTWKPPSHAKE